jgi:heme exporter protein B
MKTLWLVKTIFLRDIQLAMNRLSDLVAMLFFFIITVSLFPLAIGSSPSLIHTIGPGILWVCALLSAILSLPKLFLSDFTDGSLEQIVLSPVPLSLAVGAKVLAHWCISGLPLIILTPILALQFDASSKEIGILTISLLLGTPLLSLIGGIGAALTLGIRGSGVLLAILILPLYIPVLIFGAGAAMASMSGIDPQGAFSLLGAFLVLAVAFAPFTIATSLRMALD